MTAEDVLDQIADLPPRELARVSDYCASLLAKTKIAPAQEGDEGTDPVEELIDVLGQIKLDPSKVNGDTRLAYLMEKHGAKG